MFIFLLVALPKIAMADGLVQKATKTDWPECFCTDKQGKRRELGEIACLSIGSRSFMAKCVMAQNVPFWRDLNEGCLSSHLPLRLFPEKDQVALYR